MASPHKRRRGREDRFDFLRSIPGVHLSKVDAAIKACGRLTDQQLEGIKQVRTPEDIAAGSRITLILAAAAAGKTSTMLALVEALCAFGHGTFNANQFTLFAMFNKIAATDGNKRMAGEVDEYGSVTVPGLSKFALNSVDCRTSHSAVLRHTPELERNVQFANSGGGFKGPRDANWKCFDYSQEQMEKYVLRHRGDSIRNFVLCGQPLPADQKGRKKLQRDEELCAFWIYKTWLNWVQKAGGEAALGPNEIDPNTRIGKLTYYPIIKNHKGEGGESGDGKKCRRKRLVGTHPGTFYTSEALALWRRMMEDRAFLSHDSYLKYAEVAKVRFSRFSNILLDESQDLTECQVQVFVVNQPHADVYIVGDAVQSLYSWRGARPKQLRTLSQRVGPQRSIKEDLQLTHSHRFGSGIARIANHITFIKKHSAQHTLWHQHALADPRTLVVSPRALIDRRSRPLCRSYSVVGAGPPTLQLLDGSSRESSLEGKPRTVVGRTNAGLIIEAFELLSDDDAIKIGLLGKGSYDKFESICKDVLELLPYAEDKEQPFKFKGGAYDNWKDFEQEVEDRELPYGTPLVLIGKFAEEGTLPALVATFRRGVLERRLPENECMVLLATACGAKGLEWDNVKVLNDYARLMTFERVPEDELRAGSDYARIHHDASARAPPPGAAGLSNAPPAGTAAVSMRFQLVKDWKGDELNSWYVAITRARVRLELPERLWHLYRAVWHGEGYSPDPDDKDAPEFSAEETAGINELLARMGRELPPAGPEYGAAATAVPPSPATAQATNLAQLHVASPQAVPFSIRSAPFFLASAPVSALAEASALVARHGGEYAAGDKDDTFNSTTLTNRESWKVGWKGKVEMCINLLKKHNPGQEITVLAIAGGRSCDWERAELRNTFCAIHSGVLKLKQLGDVEGLQWWLERNYPLQPE